MRSSHWAVPLQGQSSEARLLGRAGMEGVGSLWLWARLGVLFSCTSSMWSMQVTLPSDAKE